MSDRLLIVGTLVMLGGGVLGFANLAWYIGKDRAVPVPVRVVIVTTLVGAIVVVLGLMREVFK